MERPICIFQLRGQRPTQPRLPAPPKHTKETGNGSEVIGKNECIDMHSSMGQLCIARGFDVVRLMLM